MVVDVTAREVGGVVVFSVNLYERRGRDRPGVALVEGANVVGARVRDEDTIINAQYGATDGSGWEEGARLFGSAVSSESAARHWLRERFEAIKVTEQSALDAALRTRLEGSQWETRAVAAQVTNRPPGSLGSMGWGMG